MNQHLMERLFNIANDEDYIAFHFSNKEITMQKKFIVDYKFYNNGNHLQIIFNNGKKTLLIKTDCIYMVTLSKPKFKGLTWYSQEENKTQAGVE